MSLEQFVPIGWSLLAFFAAILSFIEWRASYNDERLRRSFGANGLKKLVSRRAERDPLLVFVICVSLLTVGVAASALPVGALRSVVTGLALIFVLPVLGAMVAYWRHDRRVIREYVMSPNELIETASREAVFAAQDAAREVLRDEKDEAREVARDDADAAREVVRNDDDAIRERKDDKADVLREVTRDGSDVVREQQHAERNLAGHENGKHGNGKHGNA